MMYDDVNNHSNKRRKNIIEMAFEGYDTDMFCNDTECQKYVCAVCLCVMRDVYDIGCNEGHNFCKACLSGLQRNERIFDLTVSCPLCKESVPFWKKRPNKFVDRLINELIVTECKNKCGKKHVTLGEYKKTYRAL